MSENEFDVTNLSSAEIKSKIQRDRIWPQYTQRIKTLERDETEVKDTVRRSTTRMETRMILFNNSLNFV